MWSVYEQVATLIEIGCLECHEYHSLVAHFRECQLALVVQILIDNRFKTADSGVANLLDIHVDATLHHLVVVVGGEMICESVNVTTNHVCQLCSRNHILTFVIIIERATSDGNHSLSVGSFIDR